jgi:hypothetical protein
MTWVWLALVIAAAIGGVWAASSSLRAWVRRAGAFLASASVAAAVTMLLAQSLASRVSSQLAAPNPVNVMTGLYVFLGLAVLWTAFAWLD